MTLDGPIAAASTAPVPASGRHSPFFTSSTREWPHISTHTHHHHPQYSSSSAPGAFSKKRELPGSHNQSHNQSHSQSHSHRGDQLAAQDTHATGSVLDQLHAEQRSTIEALSYQVEFYRQREDRSRQEVEALRSFIAELPDDDSNPNDSQQRQRQEEGKTVARLARENRTLGEELDTLHQARTTWRDERARLQRRHQEQAQQLQDAQTSLASFAQAIEQLELKLQRQQAQEHARVLAADQDEETLRQRLQAAERGADESSRLRQRVTELEAQLTQQQQQEQELLKQQQQQQSTNNETVDRELERRTEALRLRVEALETDKRALAHELEMARARLSSRGNAALVTTLRAEMAALRDTLRAEYEQEQRALQQQRASLMQDVARLQASGRQKEAHITDLKQQLQAADDLRAQQETTMHERQRQIERMERDALQAQARYEELVEARHLLTAQLDAGFKELLADEQSGETARQQVTRLRHELTELQHTVTSRSDALTVAQAEAAARQQEVEMLYRQLQEKEAERRCLDELKATVARSRQERDAMQQHQEALEKDVAKVTREREELAHQVMTLQAERTHCEEKACVAQQEVTRVTQSMEALTQELARTKRSLEDARRETSKRERRLARERQQMESAMEAMEKSMEAAGTKNGELGDRVVALVRQAKRDGAERVALTTQVKAEKQRALKLERALATATATATKQQQQQVGRESSEQWRTQLRDVKTRRDALQADVTALRGTLERVQSEKNVLQHQREEAEQRVRQLRRCQEQMKSTVEAHTSELVEEIEGIQNQLENERKRCAVLLANEKTLLREINENKATVARLQQQVREQQQHTQQHKHKHKQMQMLPADAKRGDRTGSSASFSSPPPSPTDENGSAPVTPSSSTPKAWHTAMYVQACPHSPPQALSPSASASAHELNRVLGNLERISEFSILRR